METIIAILGWSGVVALLGAYAAATSGRMSFADIKLQSTNFFAGAALCINAGYNGALPSAFTNAVWAFIGLVGLLRSWKQNSAQ